MVSKILVLALSFFSQNRENLSDGQIGPVEFIKKTVRDEVSAMAFRIFLGLILAAVVILSVFQFGKSFHLFLSQFENPLVLDLVSFGIAAILGSVFLYLLFYPGFKSSKAINKRTQVNANNVDFQLVAGTFIEGFIKGLHTQPDHSKEKLNIHDN